MTPRSNPLSVLHIPAEPFWKPNRKSCSIWEPSTLPIRSLNGQSFISTKASPWANITCKPKRMPFIGGVNAYYRPNRMQEAARNFNDYLSLTTQKNTEMYALAYYNLAYITFHKKRLCNGARPLPKVHPTAKKRRCNRSCRRIQPYR